MNLQTIMHRCVDLMSPDIAQPYNRNSPRQRAIQNVLQRGFPYSRSVHPVTRFSRRKDLILYFCRKLSRHSSCVNSLAYTNDGRWLASAGDGGSASGAETVLKQLMPRVDPYIFLWDFHQDELETPSHAFRGPRVRNVYRHAIFVDYASPL